MGWYILGSLLVVPAFSGIFVDFGFLKNATNPKFINTWYLVLPAIFNIGWAAVQISTMAIVPSLTYSQRRRDEMVNGRNIFTYLANIFMLTLSLILFMTIPSASFTFTLLTIICLVIGGMTTIFFIVLIRERKLSEEALELDKRYKERMNAGMLLNPTNIKKKEESGKSPVDWLKECQFYVFGFVYMFARLALNSNATMMPFYLISVSQFKPLPGLETSP